jgi:hypothetical protein
MTIDSNDTDTTDTETAAPAPVSADRVSVERDDHVAVRDRTTDMSTATWSPAQIIGLIAGIGFVALGIAGLARTGFNTAHIYTPHDMVWRLPHSPLLGAIEVGFGALLIIGSLVPGGARPFLGFLGAIALAFGLVVLIEQEPNRLNHWLAVTHRSGWLFGIVGLVVLLGALFAPVFGSTTHRRVVRSHQLVS